MKLRRVIALLLPFWALKLWAKYEERKTVKKLESMLRTLKESR